MKADRDIEIVILGSNGWFDSKTGNTICLLVKTPRCNIVLDAGNGFAKLPAYLGASSKPVYLFLSHFHLDHVVGLHSLALNAFPGGLTILSGRGGQGALAELLRPPYAGFLDHLPFKTRFIELYRPEEGDGAKLESSSRFIDDKGLAVDLPFRAQALPLVHSSECFGIRLEIDGRVISYVADTGDCENARSLARGADILFTECAYRPGEENPGWPHLNPETAADIALNAGAKRLVLVHFDAHRYPDFPIRRRAETTARRVFKPSRAGRDGDSFRL